MPKHSLFGLFSILRQKGAVKCNPRVGAMAQWVGAPAVQVWGPQSTSPVPYGKLDMAVFVCNPRTMEYKKADPGSLLARLLTGKQ